jgi:hypothetical protein
MSAVAVQNVAVPATSTEPSREEVLARYRHLRKISKQHHSELVKHYLSYDAILRDARRIGLAIGKTMVLEDMVELNLALDLAIHTASLGRSRAIDRYAGLAGFAPQSDEARVLEAMRQARFSVLGIERRHETAGLVVQDLLHGLELWLVDEGLESSAPDGMLIATRFFTVDSFSMTAGVLVPLGHDMMEDLTVELEPLRRKPPRQGSDDRRFVEGIYRVAVEHRVTERIVYRDPGLPIEPP